MNKKIKKWLGIIGACIGLFLFIFIAAFFLCFTFMSIFVKFELLASAWTFLIALLASLCITTLIFTYILIRIKREKVTKLSHWISLHLSKLILAYIFVNIFFVSIRSDLIWDYNALKDVLSLIWVIFGLSLTIFLVWNVLIVEYIKSKEPKPPADESFKNKYKFLKVKIDFYQQTDATFGNIILLFVNLIIAIFATVSVYVIAKEINLFSQTLVLLGLYLSTNTIVNLLIDMMRPVLESRRQILKENKVEETELKIAYLQATLQIKIEEVHNMIYENDKLSQEEKDKLFGLLIEEVRQIAIDTTDEK